MVALRLIAVLAPVLAPVLALAGCSQPMLSADIAIDEDGLSVRPALSGSVGDAIINVRPD